MTIDRRTAIGHGLRGAAAMLALATPACGRAGNQGDAASGGDTASVDLFSTLATAIVPRDADAIETRGFVRPGLGAARYVRDDMALDFVASHPRALVRLRDGRVFRLAGSDWTPEQFGARGDGRANDTEAFAALGRWLSVRGGGTARLRRATYLLGRQRAGGGVGQPAFVWTVPLAIRDCTGPVRIVGDRAVLRCAPGLRYGTFDPRSGEPTDNAMPFLDIAQIAGLYEGMIVCERNIGPVEISGIELDGAIGAARLGGGYGDVGRQLPASGIYAMANRGPIILRDLNVHDQGLDGIMIARDEAADGEVLIERVRCDRNGRQGLSIVGGRGFRIAASSFTRTGRGPVASPPAAGVDLEAETGPIRNVAFVDCRMADNVGAGFVTDSGDVADVSFERCAIVGTTNWAALPNKPRVAFSDCLMVGGSALCYPMPDGGPDATRFVDCRFTDDPAESPTGQVHGGPIVDLGGGPTGTLFERCRFDLVGDSILPATLPSTRYVDCVMTQASATPSAPRGTWRGRNRIDGPVMLDGSDIRGEIVLNGRRLART